MKKMGIVALLAIAILIALSQTSYYRELIILNWQDYLSQDVIQAFEEENDCIVTELTVASNEQMYANILNRKAPYDLVIPSDYMIDKMYKEGLLKEIDFSLLSNYGDDIFIPELNQLINSEENIHYKNSFIPYFCGSLCIMYNKVNYPEIGDIIEEHGIDVFYEPELLPKNAKVAMYDSSRDAFAAAELYLGYSLNTTDKKELDDCAKLIKEREFKIWGTDELKIGVASGNIDVALMYSGDFFDVYYADSEGDHPEKVDNYGVYSPKKANNVFYDGLVIPITSQETELAHKFLDFILEFDNNYTNADNVGYCPTLKSVYDDIMSDPEWEDVTSIGAYSPVEIIRNAKDKAEVYRDLGEEAYRYMEKLYQEVRFL